MATRKVSHTAESLFALVEELSGTERARFYQLCARDGARVVAVEVNLIDRNPRNPRRRFDKARLASLGDSLATHKQTAPVQLTLNPEVKGRFLLVDGERRWQAAQQRGLSRLRAVIEEMSADEAECAMVLSHMQSEPLKPMEIARCAEIAMRPKTEGGLGMTSAQVADFFGSSDEKIRGLKSLIELPAWLQELIDTGCVPWSAARDAKGIIMSMEEQQLDQFRRECDDWYTGETKAPSKDGFMEHARARAGGGDMEKVKTSYLLGQVEKLPRKQRELWNALNAPREPGTRDTDIARKLFGEEGVSQVLKVLKVKCTNKQIPKWSRPKRS